MLGRLPRTPASFISNKPPNPSSTLSLGNSGGDAVRRFAWGKVSWQDFARERDVLFGWLYPCCVVLCMLLVGYNTKSSLWNPGDEWDDRLVHPFAEMKTGYTCLFIRTCEPRWYFTIMLGVNKVLLWSSSGFIMMRELVDNSQQTKHK